MEAAKGALLHWLRVKSVCYSVRLDIDEIYRMVPNGEEGAQRGQR